MHRNSKGAGTTEKSKDPIGDPLFLFANYIKEQSIRKSFMVGDIKVTIKNDGTIVGLEGPIDDIYHSGLELNKPFTNRQKA